MIYGVLIKFNQNLNKNQDLNEYKLLTINLLDVNKDQLITGTPSKGISPDCKDILNVLNLIAWSKIYF